MLLARLWRRLGIAEGITLKLNSIGDLHERLAHRSALVAYFERHRTALDADSIRRLATNPLRILDSKNPTLDAVIAGAPKMIDFIADRSLAHFEELKVLLAEAGIAFEVEPRLVRGLDYYNRTVFEFVTDRLGAQGTVAGGGRYDGLFEQFGGKPTPACGFALGIERMILLLQEARLGTAVVPDAYVVHAGEAGAKLARRISETLRDAGRAIVVNAGGGSFKSQMKKADASGAAYALIIGDDEVAAGSVSMKPLRADGDQVAVPVAELAQALVARN